MQSLPSVGTSTEGLEASPIPDGTRSLDGHATTLEAENVAGGSERSAEDYILRNPISDIRKREFLSSFVRDRTATATLQMLFERVGHFQQLLDSEDFPGETAGFNHLLFKGPFVDGSNWLPYSTWGFAVAMEQHLFGRLDSELKKCIREMNPNKVERDGQNILRATDQMCDDLAEQGYSPSVVVLTGKLGTNLHVELIKAIRPEWELRDELPTTFRILGTHRDIPILDVPESDTPGLYVGDLAQFGSLTKYGVNPEFSLSAINDQRADELLSSQPLIVKDPPPSAANQSERLRRVQLMVQLRLYETYSLAIRNRLAIVGRPLA